MNAQWHVYVLLALVVCTMHNINIYGQAVSYMGSEPNYCQKWQIQKWQKISQIIAKTGNIWTKLVQIWMIKVAKYGKKP